MRKFEKTKLHKWVNNGKTGVGVTPLWPWLRKHGNGATGQVVSNAAAQRDILHSAGV